MSRTLFCIASAFSILFVSLPAMGDDTTADAANARGIELFKTKIEPVLVKHCYECHSKNGESIEGGLELDSPAGLLRGGDAGPMLKPHDLDKSSIVRMLHHADDVSGMPPEQKLPDEVIAAFEEWIRLGAPDSRKETGPTLKEQRFKAGQEHWSFVLPKSSDPPSVKQADWPRDTMIDRFILSALEAKQLTPVSDASRRTLIRRIYFDLIGLPPSPEEVATFLADDSQEAVASLVDKLLASPRFGERWGRHWLDVVRFAESSGMEFNFTYPHAWPYRNYVIDSFNQDKPFDLFVREQIAGDLMPTEEGDSAEVIETRRIASGMLAFGPKRHNSGGMDFRMDVVDDQINTVSRAMLGLTVSCARCHDHKFDPIPTADYYAMAGIFLSTEPLFGTIKQKYSNNPTDLLPIGADGQTLHEAAELHEKKIKETETTLTAKKEDLKKAQEERKLAESKRKEVETLIASTAAIVASDATDESPPPATEPAATQADLDKADTQLAELTKQIDDLTAALPQLESQIAELKKNRPARPQYAMSARDRKKPFDTTIAIRGNYKDKGDVVPRGFLSVIPADNPSKIEATHSGRLELANWITSDKNPLTARVMVNRIWHHLFGRGIVPTVDNFGVIGKTPSHPQLLDALALQFKNDGWSTKRMIRKIMLSRTYQLSSTPNESNLNIDPNNRLLWRATPRRLEAETIRDAVLAVSGQLNLDRPSGSTVTPLGDKLVRGIATDKLQPQSNHRSVYLPVVRDYVPELFDLFDFPSPSLVSGRRSVTNVPSQALYLRNSQFIADQAMHAAKRLLASKQATDNPSRVDLATQWALGRPAAEVEKTEALKLIEQSLQASEPKEEDAETKAWAAWFHTLFMTAEFRYLVDAT